MNNIFILGTRGIPAKHGGFETFAEKLALYLTDQKWSVYVYCQENGSGPIYYEKWNNITLIKVPVKGDGTLSTIIFDYKVTIHAAQKANAPKSILLTLGYNTAIFNIINRVAGQKNIINMDGIEWRRDKWGLLAKCWFWVNERIGVLVGNHLVADHPEIKNHLSTKIDKDKITMIPYGGDKISSPPAIDLLEEYNLKEENYSIIIARPEPENSIFEIVEAFSRKKRNHKLVVLGKYSPESNPYHKKILSTASDEVIFTGPIYKKETLYSLRYYSLFYIHGHTVGGTNPSLVEALGAGSAILAHDNVYNRWVAEDGAIYFKSSNDCALIFDENLKKSETIDKLRQNSISRHTDHFQWNHILDKYQSLLLKYIK